MSRSRRVVRSMVGTIAAAVMALAVTAIGSAQADGALPAGGGEPGKVYFAVQKAMKAQDLAALKTLVSATRAKQMDDPEFKEMLGLMVEMMPTEVTITGGTVTGDRATLTMTGARGSEKSTGEALLVKEGGAWKLDKESWKN